MIRYVRRASSRASATDDEGTAQQVHVGRGERDVGARAHRDPHVGRGERRGVVQAVAHEDHRAAGLRGAAGPRRPCPRGTPRPTPSRSPTSAAIASAVARRSPVTIATSSPSACSRATAPAASGLIRSATATSPSGMPSRQTANGVSPSRGQGRRPRARGEPATPRAARRAPRRRRASATAPAPGSTRWSVRLGHREAPRPRALDDGAGDRVLRARLGRRGRARSAPSSVSPFAGMTAASVICPSVTVPVLSRSTMSAARATSKTAPPLNSTPISAARPVPAMIAAGVARPSAHGHAISNTATAWRSAVPGRLIREQRPADERRRRDADHDRHEDGGDPVRQALDGRLRSLRRLQEPDDLGELRVRRRPW